MFEYPYTVSTHQVVPEGHGAGGGACSRWCLHLEAAVAATLPFHPAARHLDTLRMRPTSTKLAPLGAHLVQ